MLIVLACAATIAGVVSTIREWRIVEVQNLLERQAVLMDQQDDRWRGPGIATVALSAPARVLMADALYSARLAAGAPAGTERNMLIARARAETIEARQRRPHWGDAWILSAFIDSLDSPAMREEERLAIIRSYLDAPLLREAGPWRATRGLANWSAFPRSIRDAITEETAWLLYTLPSGERPALFEAARRSPAYAAVFRRWTTLR